MDGEEWMGRRGGWEERYMGRRGGWEEGTWGGGVDGERKTYRCPILNTPDIFTCTALELHVLLFSEHMEKGHS